MDRRHLYLVIFLCIFFVRVEGEEEEDTQTLRKRELDHLTLSSESGIVHLSFKEYLCLVFPAPRNFSVFTLFYSDEKQCPNCRGFMAWWMDLALAARAQLGDKDNPVYFTSLKVGRKSRNKVKVKAVLNTTEPHLYYFGNTENTMFPKGNMFRTFIPSDYLEDSVREADIREIGKWVYDCSGHKIDWSWRSMISRPNFPIIPESSYSCILAMVVGVGYLVCKFCDIHQLPETVWKGLQIIPYKYLVTIGIIWCISGQVYHNVGHKGFAYYDQNGDMAFVARSYQDQMGAESLMIMFIYHLMLYGFVALVEIKEDEMNKKNKPFYVFNMVKNMAAYFAGFYGLMKIYSLKTNVI